MTQRLHVYLVLRFTLILRIHRRLMVASLQNVAFLRLFLAVSSLIEVAIARCLLVLGKHGGRVADTYWCSVRLVRSLRWVVRLLGHSLPSTGISCSQELLLAFLSVVHRRSRGLTLLIDSGMTRLRAFLLCLYVNALQHGMYINYYLFNTDIIQ